MSCSLQIPLHSHVLMNSLRELLLLNFSPLHPAFKERNRSHSSMWGSELTCFLFPTLTTHSRRGKRSLAVGPFQHNTSWFC